MLFKSFVNLLGIILIFGGTWGAWNTNFISNFIKSQRIVQSKRSGSQIICAVNLKFLVFFGFSNF